MDGTNNTSARATSAGKYNVLLLVIGWIAALLALVRVPYIFGPIGVIMGILASKSGSKAGLPVIVASILLMAAGLIYGGVIWNYLSHYLGIGI